MGDLLGKVFLVIWWVQSLVELGGAILLYVDHNTSNFLASWPIYSSHLIFMGSTLVGLGVILFAIMLANSTKVFRVFLAIYSLFVVTWAGPMLASSIVGPLNLHLLVWIALIVGSIGYAFHHRSSFSCLDQLYPVIAEFIRERRSRLLLQQGIALTFLIGMWFVWACAFTWFVIVAQPHLSSFAYGFIMAYLAWSMFWKSLIVVSGTARTVTEEAWSYFINQPNCSLCSYHALSPIGCFGAWPTLTFSSWILAYQSLWQILLILRTAATTTTQENPIPSTTSTNLTTLTNPTISTNVSIQSENMVEKPRNVLRTPYARARGAKDEEHKDASSERVVVGDYSGVANPVEVIASVPWGDVLKAALNPSRGDAPSAQFVHSVLVIEKNHDWYSAYSSAKKCLDSSPQLKYFANSHMVSFVSLWFSIAASATCVALYQIRFPSSDDSTAIDNLLITVLQVYLFLGAFVISSLFLSPLVSTLQTIIYGLSKPELLDPFKRLLERTKYPIHELWLRETFAPPAN